MQVIYPTDYRIDVLDECRAIYTDDSKQFVGWATESGSQDTIGEVTLTKDQTFYAVYRDVLVVTLKVPNGKISYRSDDASEEVKIQCVENGALETTCDSNGWAILRWEGDSGGKVRTLF